VGMSNESKNEYIVGSEAGLVFKCNIGSVTLLDGVKKGDRGNISVVHILF
jgi:hypothetical protein